MITGIAYACDEWLPDREIGRYTGGDKEEVKAMLLVDMNKKHGALVDGSDRYKSFEEWLSEWHTIRWVTEKELFGQRSTTTAPEQGAGDGSETWHKFFNIIMTNRAITKNPEYYGHNENVANQILDLLDVIDSYSKERAKLEAENKALRELCKEASDDLYTVQKYLAVMPNALKEWDLVGTVADDLAKAADALKGQGG